MCHHLCAISPLSASTAPAGAGGLGPRLGRLSCRDGTWVPCSEPAPACGFEWAPRSSFGVFRGARGVEAQRGLHGQNVLQTAEFAGLFERILPKTRLTDGLTLEMLLSANTGCPNVPISVAFSLFFLLKISFAVSLNLSVLVLHILSRDCIPTRSVLRSHVFLHIVDEGQRRLYQGVCTYPAFESSNSLSKYETQMLTQYIGLALATTIPHAPSMIMQPMPLRPHLLRSLPPSTSTNIRRLA